MDQKTTPVAVQFESLFECIPIGVFIIDENFRIAHVNPLAAPSFSEIAGGVIGRDFGEVLLSMRESDYATEVTRIFRRTLVTGETFSKAETFSQRGRPAAAFYEWRVERIALEGGSFGLACFFRDISHEIRAHQLDSFRLALTDTLRPLTSAADVQAAAARLLGEQLVASSVMYTEVSNHDDGDHYNVRQHYRANDVMDFSGEYRADDFGQTLFDESRAGRTLVIDDVLSEERLGAQERAAYAAIGVRAYINVPLVKEGRHVAQLSVHQNEPRSWTNAEVATVKETAERTWAAAERARAEEQVHNSQADSARQRRLYEAVLNNTPDLAYVWNREHRFIYANEGLLKMWDKTREQAIGRHCLELGYEPWHAEMHDREIDQVIATKQPVRGEVPFAGAFGRRIYDYILVPVLGPDGEVEAVAGTTRDVTEIKESDQRKDEFLATLAHELRNPLAPIRSAIQVLSLSARGDEPVKQVCDMMERQVSHMVRLVDDLMEISRISRGAIELRRETTTLEAIVRSAVDTSTPLIIASAHKLTLTLPEHAVVLHGDAVRLAQVIANLLNNAAKYTDHGGRIWLNAEQQHDVLVICVRDTGIGISSEALPTIFDMFVQVKSPASHNHGGLGIGLSLVKHLTEMHGGSVSATSRGVGQGSEFCIRLPCLETPHVNDPVAAGTNETLEIKKRVLIVDDNEDAAMTLEMLVTLLGADVRVANDGVSALALMSSFRPEIALLDLGMPLMNGFEVAALARQLPGMDKLRLIALTGWGQPEDRERTRVAGFNHHLVKPVALPELEKVLTSDT